MENITAYEIDRETELQLEKKISELKTFCVSNRIPMFVTAATKNNDKETTYIKDIYSPEVSQITLKDDKITKHLNVVLGLFDEKTETLFSGSYEDLIDNIESMNK